MFKLFNSTMFLMDGWSFLLSAKHQVLRWTHLKVRIHVFVGSPFFLFDFYFLALHRKPWKSATVESYEMNKKHHGFRFHSFDFGNVHESGTSYNHPFTANLFYKQTAIEINAQTPRYNARKIEWGNEACAKFYVAGTVLAFEHLHERTLLGFRIVGWRPRFGWPYGNEGGGSMNSPMFCPNHQTIKWGKLQINWLVWWFRHPHV